MSKHSKQFLERILNGASNPIFVKDSNLRFVLVNDAFTLLTGIAEHDIIGKDDYDFFPKDLADSFKILDEEVLNGGEEIFNEEKLLSQDGVTLTLNTGKRCITDEVGNRFIVGNIYDTTEKSQFIESLKMSNQMLKRYAHLVSHDLKSPIITINRFSELLSRSAGSKLNASETEYLNFITNSSLRLYELVLKILDFSHLNMQQLSLTEVDVNELIADIRSDLCANFEDSGCSLEVGNLPGRLICDRHLLNSVFQNLISNSIKFKSIDKNCIIKISHDQTNNIHLFTVSDNGIGIDKKDHEKVFDMFSRSNSSLKISGSGIGLALSKMIVERHAGKIWIESELGKGSKFKFTIEDKVSVPILS